MTDIDCSAMQDFGSVPTFRVKLLPPSSGMKWILFESGSFIQVMLRIRPGGLASHSNEIACPYFSREKGGTVLLRNGVQPEY
jgi:hypothetical protein